MEILHHGAVSSVTGSCHELAIDDQNSLLVDCGLFQGLEAADELHRGLSPIGFSVHRIRALIITHCHIDHVGRIPELIAAGYTGPIYCSEPTALLLPLVMDDALRMGVTKNRRLIQHFLHYLQKHLVPIPYKQWIDIPLEPGSSSVRIRLQRAGHILGSAYIEVSVKRDKTGQQVVFSGDLGAPYTPLLPPPRAPWSADILVLESTYGDRLHEGRKARRERLRRLVERCFRDRGVILIPAFSIGRTQELLYEFEAIIYRFRAQEAARGVPWEEIEIVLDSPLASRFTEAYKKLKPFWDDEARERLEKGRHPLSFDQLTTIDDHETHLQAVEYLRRKARPTIVISGSGMCSGGRIVNYLKAMLGDSRTDVLFVGYQAAGTPGRDILRYGPDGGYVVLDGKRIDIKAGIHNLSGYSAHADKKDLLNFIRRIRHKPHEIRLVHGESDAKQALKTSIEREFDQIHVVIPDQ